MEKKTKNWRKGGLWCTFHSHKCEAILKFWIHVQYVVHHTVKQIVQYIVEHLGRYIFQIIAACHSQQHYKVEVNSPKKADTNIFFQEENPKLSTQSHGFGKSFNVLQSFAFFLSCKLFCEQKQHVVDVSPTAMTSWEISTDSLL